MKTGLTAMIYRDFDYGQRVTMRVPQHAAPFGVPAPSFLSRRFGLSVPFRRRSRQTLRLVVTTGMWAAGLCLVIGALALVVAAAAPNHSPHAAVASQRLELVHPSPGVLRQSADTPGTRAAARPTASPGSTTAPPQTASHNAVRVLALFTGSGNAVTRQFRLSSAHRWGVRWAYACPARANRFLVKDVQIVGTSTRVRSGMSQSGTSGSGVTWLRSGSLSHYFIVRSTCSWTMRVVQEA